MPIRFFCTPQPGSADEYRQALARVAEETAALHSLVDDLLWLARFESEPKPPAAETVQLADAAPEAGARFAGLAEHGGLELAVVTEQPAQVQAPARGSTAGWACCWPTPASIRPREAVSSSR